MGVGLVADVETAPTADLEAVVTARCRLKN
jgi:hypothetical protein